MKNKKTLIIVVAIVLVLVIALLAFISTKDLREVAKLRAEADKLGKMDITKDEIDMSIKTTGDYATLEKTMKEYMNKYATLVKDLTKILEDEKLIQILSAENYKNDGPEFTESKAYITDARSNFNEKINTLIDMTKEETMINAIKEKNVSDQLVELYKELMLGKEMTTDLEETAKSLEDSSATINKVLDIQENVLNMLITNKGQWKVNDEDEVEFSSQRLVDQYNKYLESLSEE